MGLFFGHAPSFATFQAVVATLMPHRCYVFRVGLFFVDAPSVAIHVATLLLRRCHVFRVKLLFVEATSLPRFQAVVAIC